MFKSIVIRYIRRSRKKVKQIKFKLVITFYRLLFSRYNCSRYNYSRYSCQIWRSCSLDVTILQTQLLSKHSYSPDMTILQIQLPSTQLFSRCGCPLHSYSLNVGLLFSAAKRTGYFRPIRHLIILQTWLFSRRNQDFLIIVS